MSPARSPEMWKKYIEGVITRASDIESEYRVLVEAGGKSDIILGTCEGAASTGERLRAAAAEAYDGALYMLCLDIIEALNLNKKNMPTIWPIVGHWWDVRHPGESARISEAEYSEAISYLPVFKRNFGRYVPGNVA